MTEPNRDWIGRVKEADAYAERLYAQMQDETWGAVDEGAPMAVTALIAIAAELRAQRIARRPGAGQ